ASVALRTVVPGSAWFAGGKSRPRRSAFWSTLKLRALLMFHTLSVFLLFGATASAAPTVSRPRPLAGCIESGTEADINSAVVGDEAEAVLCPNAVFALTNPVVFTAPNQRIYTQGPEDGASRAVLRIAGGTLTKAIDGNNQSGIVIQGIEVDGNRPELGYQSGDALIEIGHA